MTTLIEHVSAARVDPAEGLLPAMRQNATKCDTFDENRLPSLTRMTIPRITAQQETAISMLVSGRSLGTVAHALRIHRSTLSRWRHQDPVFQAELARRQREVCDVADARLRLLTLKATKTLEQGFENQHVKSESKARIALRLLMSMQAKQPREAPMTDPRLALEGVIRQARAGAGQTRDEILAPIRAEEWAGLIDHISASAQDVEALPEMSSARWRGLPAVESTDAGATRDASNASATPGGPSSAGNG